jgi:Domain of unknown function (DUF4234)
VAEVVQIKGTDAEGKLRNPFGVIGLSLITLGIYWWFWYYKVNKELAEMGRARNTEELGTSPGTSLLAVTLGCFIIVPPFVSIYKTWVRKRNAARLVGADEGLEPWLGWLITVLIGIIGMYLIQDNMNKILTAQAGGAGELPVADAVATPTPAAPEAPPQAPEAPQPPAQPQP